MELTIDDLSGVEPSRELWRRGVLSWLLRPHQLVIYRQAMAMIDSHREAYLNCARKLGKSTIGIIYAFERALQSPGVDVPVIGPTQKQVEMYLLPIVALLTAKAPAEYRPVWHDQKKYYWLPSSKSRVHICGTDNRRYENLRGPQYPDAVIDEAGSCDALRYVLQDIINPAGSRCQGRKLILSTPPVSPVHDLVTLWDESKARGTYLHYTIDHDPTVSDDEKRILFAEAGGADSTSVQREYYGRIVTESTRAVLPEMDDVAVADIVKEWPLPEYVVLSGALDPGAGTRHWTGYLTGYYDCRAGLYVVDAELLLKGQTTQALADEIKRLEFALYGGRPVNRWSDTEMQVIRDLYGIYNLAIMPTQKDSKASVIQFVRELIKSRRIVIHSRCVELVRQMQSVIYKPDRNNWEESASCGHFDLVAALLYLVRNIDVHTNPYPELSDVRPDGTRVRQPRRQKTGWDKFASSF